jgi:hypothetical protein
MNQNDAATEGNSISVDVDNIANQSRMVMDRMRVPKKQGRMFQLNLG